MSVLLETSAGDLVIDLLVEESPKACLNFLKLCKFKYYNFSPLYNLQVPAFFQSGDPDYPVGDGGRSCWGASDPDRRFFRPEVTRRAHERGSVSMACSADGLCGSQFFVCLGPNASFARRHALFGRLAEGFETLDAIAAVPVDGDFRPLRDVRIKHAIVLEDPFEDPAGLGAPPEGSPPPTARQLSTVRIAFHESLEETATVEELEARGRAREARASALTLETLGDLPFAHVRPPENILFVCKLNPVTSSEDLELIFGRFGRVLSCQVVRDGRTGDSLQYAFVEFDVKEAAEQAYFKMQCVLIDDRRIHVDFSQSVAKVPRGRGGGRRDGGGRGDLAARSGGRRPDSERRSRRGGHGGYDMVFCDDDERAPSRRARADEVHDDGRERHGRRDRSGGGGRRRRHDDRSRSRDRRRDDGARSERRRHRDRTRSRSRSRERHRR